MRHPLCVYVLTLLLLPFIEGLYQLAKEVAYTAVFMSLSFLVGAVVLGSILVWINNTVEDFVDRRRTRLKK